jgi:hypothetical protein
VSPGFPPGSPSAEVMFFRGNEGWFTPSSFRPSEARAGIQESGHYSRPLPLRSKFVEDEHDNDDENAT